MNAVIEATLTANTSRFTTGLNNAGTQVSNLEQQIRRASGIPLPGEGRAAAASASVFAAQAQSMEKVTAARYRAMEAAKAEESQIRANIRAREDEAAAAARVASAASPGTAPTAGTPAAGPRGIRERITDWRKGAMRSLADVGASDLVKGFGIGALVAGMRAVLTNAQAARAEALAMGKALDPAVARTAEIADGFDQIKSTAFSVAASVLSWVQGGVDRLVAGASAALGLGTYAENMAAIKTRDADVAAQKKAEIAAKARAEAEKEALAAAQELAAAQAELADARIQAAKAAADTEGKIQIAALEVADAQEAVNAAKADTVEHAKAELELLARQQDLAALQLEREKEISAEKERSAEAEQQAAAARLAAQEKLNTAIAAEQAARARVASAQAAYATALSDQSAATLGEVESGERGSPADRRRAAEVARLRARARTARDEGRVSLIGGEAVSVADQLSARANQVQSTIGALNTAERNPLGAVTEQLKQANEELAAIRESLALVELG